MEVIAPYRGALDGWSSGVMAPEVGDYLLMQHMNWSWRDLQECPVYMRRVVAECRGQEIAVTNAQHERQEWERSQQAQQAEHGH